MITFRKAKREDLETIINMIANDAVAAKREDNSMPLNEGYIKAFEMITSDANQYLMVADKAGEVIGTFQMILIPSLTYIGRARLLIEGVRIADNYQGQGIGQRMIQHAINFGKDNHVSMIQLTTDKKRPKAIEFYLKLGFIDSHEGMKYKL